MMVMMMMREVCCTDGVDVVGLLPNSEMTPVANVVYRYLRSE